jgi:hypothetical protein
MKKDKREDKCVCGHRRIDHWITGCIYTSHSSPSTIYKSCKCGKFKLAKPNEK